MFLTSFSPLSDLYDRSATTSPARDWFSFWGDLVLRVVAYLFLVWLVVRVALKLFEPLPSFPWPF